MAPTRKESAPPGTSDRAGTFRRTSAGGETYCTFHPKPLPPGPPLVLDAITQELLATANQALGRLDGITLLITIPQAASKTGLSEVTVAKAAAHLETLGIAREVTRRSRNKVFVYAGYLALLQEGTGEGQPGPTRS